jgi:hypothetical protein
MSFCLLLLTGINFILYPQNNNSITWNINSTGDIGGEEAPQVPTEEKSSENSNTVQEDFLNEHDSVYWLFPQILLLHNLMSADKIQAIHFELISPPPDC